MVTQKTNMVMGTALSIHPRNWFMVDSTYKRGEKINTSERAAAPKVGAHERHIAANPKDSASRAHLAKRVA